jgi:exosortase
MLSRAAGSLDKLSAAGARRALPMVALATASIWLVWPAFAHAFEVWSTTEEFSYGFLIPPISIGIIWWRREALRTSIASGARMGMLIVVLSLGVYLLAERLSIHALAGIAVSPLLWGGAVYVWGWRAGRVLAFPIGFLVFGLGVFRGLLDTVGFALQGVTAVGAAALAQAIGVGVVREGLVLSSDRFAFIVAEACSGMSSLVSLLALAALWTYAARGSVPARMAVMLSVAPLAIAANSIRVAMVLLIAHVYGQEAALGFFHSFSSLVLFGLALTGLYIVSRLVGCQAFAPAQAAAAA